VDTSLLPFDDDLSMLLSVDDSPLLLFDDDLLNCSNQELVDTSYTFISLLKAFADSPE
jgi:hypothetical protein